MMECVGRNEYTTISIPTNIATKIDTVLKKGGYCSRPDFVRDAVRKLLATIEQEEQNTMGVTY